MLVLSACRPTPEESAVVNTKDQDYLFEEISKCYVAYCTRKIDGIPVSCVNNDIRVSSASGEDLTYAPTMQDEFLEIAYTDNGINSFYYAEVNGRQAGRGRVFRQGQIIEADGLLGRAASAGDQPYDGRVKGTGRR